MPIARDTSRFALRPATNPTVTAASNRSYTTFWNYREGWAATTDPKLSKIMVGVACVSAAVSVTVGVAAIIRGLSDRSYGARAIPAKCPRPPSDPPRKRPELPRGTYR